MNDTKNLDKNSARSEGKTLSVLAKVKFCILENVMSNCIYDRAMFLVFDFLHFPCKLRLHARQINNN